MGGIQRYEPNSMDNTAYFNALLFQKLTRMSLLKNGVVSF